MSCSETTKVAYTRSQQGHIGTRYSGKPMQQTPYHGMLYAVTSGASVLESHPQVTFRSQRRRRRKRIFMLHKSHFCMRLLPTKDGRGTIKGSNVTPTNESGRESRPAPLALRLVSWICRLGEKSPGLPQSVRNRYITSASHASRAVTHQQRWRTGCCMFATVKCLSRLPSRRDSGCVMFVHRRPAENSRAATIGPSCEQPTESIL